MIKTSLINIMLRGLTLISKFILLIYIASYLTPAELGIYGLVSVSIAISLYLLGMDFYTFNTREIIAQTEECCTPLIRDQLVFHALVYLIVLPLLLILFIFKFIAWQYIGWFYVLLILEHLSQESHRLLITLSRPTMANIVLFLRSGIWVYAVIAAGYFYRDSRTLQCIWALWCVGAMLCVTMTAVSLRHLSWRETLNVSINWGWLKKGFKGALPFFGATMALLGVQYADRFFIQSYHGEDMVGFYTFYANIANVIQTFVFTGVISILYPKVIDAFQKRNYENYRLLMRKLIGGVLVGTAVLALGLALAIGPLLKVVKKSVYADYLPVFWILIIAVSILAISFIPHYGLFVRHKDKQIFLSTVIAVVVSLSLNFFLVPVYGITGAAYSGLTGYSLLLVLKLYYLRRYRDCRPAKIGDERREVML
ncbi:MAG: lipopolysaccharide biosynthesis protein [Candidatus Zixiibacteriota bacterium]